ncbi:hypothetical protein L596_023254 [Steinernema carpocapsae]|uniref:SXP/RAL-2 family protein Ani s 5-like cation-binding domain-containing protein n=1 Tax=Steinernema carpocapsae TaxID=34508 RepID=A0A4U5MD52_STECR|nr:hypothetical protein L596_023254 [Steinernema carpocapsae]
MFAWFFVFVILFGNVLSAEDPDYIKVLDLFMEKPLIDFSESLTEDEVKAYSSAYEALEGKNMTDEQFAEEVGKQSKSAMQKIINLQKAYDKMTSDLDKQSQDALETLQDIGSNTETVPTEQDVCNWILAASRKIRKLNPTEQADIERDLPNLGRIMKQTNFINVQNCGDVNMLILDMLTKFWDRD